MTKNEASQASPEMVEGPFYSNGGEYRANLREGQHGQKLDLTITVVNAECMAKSELKRFFNRLPCTPRNTAPR